MWVSRQRKVAISKVREIGCKCVFARLNRERKVRAVVRKMGIGGEKESVLIKVRGALNTHGDYTTKKNLDAFLMTATVGYKKAAEYIVRQACNTGVCEWFFYDTWRMKVWIVKVGLFRVRVELIAKKNRKTKDWEYLPVTKLENAGNVFQFVRAIEKSKKFELGQKK